MPFPPPIAAAAAVSSYGDQSLQIQSIISIFLFVTIIISTSDYMAKSISPNPINQSISLNLLILIFCVMGGSESAFFSMESESASPAPYHCLPINFLICLL